MNLQPHPDKLRADAAESALMSSSALDSERRDFFAKIGDHLTTLTSELSGTPVPVSLTEGIFALMLRSAG